MKPVRTFSLSTALLFTVAAVAPAFRLASSLWAWVPHPFAVFAKGAGFDFSPAETTPAPQAQPPSQSPTLASALDREITAVEKQLVDVAEAMPEDKFNFSPENLKIPGSDYKGVRTFASQLKHVAASNYAILSPLTGEKRRDDLFNGGKGPENVKTKADIIQFLKDSFAFCRKAVATLTAENMLQPAVNTKNSRLHMATFAIAHANDHYGQMVEYLRMNGIIPPASRANSK